MDGKPWPMAPQNPVIYHVPMKLITNSLSFRMFGLFEFSDVLGCCEYRFQTHLQNDQTHSGLQHSPGFRTGDDGTVPLSVVVFCDGWGRENRIFTPSITLFKDIYSKSMTIFISSWQNDALNPGSTAHSSSHILRKI